jgi:putative hydrolase of the HAD superfamily
MRGVLLDVGGVFLVPCRVPLIQAAGALGGGVSDAEFDRAHFEGIHALDVAHASVNEDQHIYLEAYLSSIGVPKDEVESVIETLVPLWDGPSPDLWQRVLSGSIAGLRALYDAGLKLGIVSNSDGHVEEALVRSEICQVGPGDGVPVLTVVDSEIVGVAKPDPAIFQFALRTLGLDPSDVIYVGDSVRYDVLSADAAGLTPLHFDPFGLCAGVGHAHVTSVNEVLRYVGP